jgi:hypothetical protein
VIERVRVRVPCPRPHDTEHADQVDQSETLQSTGHATSQLQDCRADRVVGQSRPPYAGSCTTTMASVWKPPSWLSASASASALLQVLEQLDQWPHVYSQSFR